MICETKETSEMSLVIAPHYCLQSCQASVQEVEFRLRLAVPLSCTDTAECPGRPRKMEFVGQGPGEEGAAQIHSVDLQGCPSPQQSTDHHMHVIKPPKTI